VPAKRAPRRLLSGLLSILSVVGVTALFGVGFSIGLLGHINLPAGRRAAAAFLNKTLADFFQGQLSIGTITKLSPDEVVADDIVVRDRSGRVVLKVTRLTAQADVLDILKRIARGDAKLTIVVDHVRVERAEAEVTPADDGIPTLAHALTPRPTPSSSAPSSSESYIRVWLPAVEIGQGFARGSLAGSPTLETDISGAHGSVLATPKGAAIDVNRFALQARGLGGADAKGVATLHIRAPGAVWGSFDGYMGDVQFGSVVRWEKEALDLKVDLPRAEPGAARALLAQWPLLVPAEAQLHIKGHPPDLDVDVQTKIGDRSTLSGTGDLNLAKPVRLQLDVEGRKLDLRALWASAPATSIDLDTSLGVHTEDGRAAVDVAGALSPTSIGAFSVPGFDFSGNAKAGIFSGQAKLHDRGLPMDVDVSVYPDGKIGIDAEAKRINLAEVERIKPYFEGSGNADLRAHAVLDHGHLETSLTLDVRSLEYHGAALQGGHLTASAKGSLDKLDQLALDARLTGKKLSAGRFTFEDVNATARGPLRVPTVTATLTDTNGPSFDARANVAVGRSVSLRELSLGVSRENVEIRGDVAQIDLDKDRILVRDLKLHGATGELSGNAELTPQALSMSAQGQNLDLSAFSRVLGLPRGMLEGRASLSIDALSSGKTQRGTLELSVSKAAIADLNGISGQLSAKLDGRRLRANATGSVESLGAFSADCDTELGGSPTERASFEHATGNATLSLSGVTLEYLGQLLPDQDVGIGGQASLTLKVMRDEPNAVPTVEVSGETQGLSVRVARPGQPALQLSGIELMASATHDGASGNSSLAVTANQGSERLVSASADITLDVKAALSGKEPLLSQLETRPLLAKMVVNRLDLDSLPAPLRRPGLQGSVRLEGTVRGSFAEPVASLAVRAGDLRWSAAGHGEAIDVCATAEYSRQNGAFNVGGELFLPPGMGLAHEPCSGKRIANVRLNGLAPYVPGRGVPNASYTAQANLEELPLDTVPQLAEAHVTGTASGSLLLDRSGQAPNASAALKLSELKVDRLEIGSGSLSLRSAATRAHAEFRVERDKTAVSGALDSGLSWSNELPAIDDAQPVDLVLHATKLEASILEPFLSDFVSELHGNLDGEVSARLEALNKGEDARRVEQVSGKVKLTDGSLVLNGLGFRIRDVDFTADARRDGKTTVVAIPDLRASAGAKIQNLSANMNLRLAGFDIVAGSANVYVTRLPLVVDGITRANADVEIQNLTLKRDADRILVDVPFNKLDIRLPDESTRQLTELDENKDVTILQPIAQPKADRGDGGLPWQFAIHLGRNAKVERGAQLDIPITGDPNVVLASGLGVTGAIMLDRRGVVQLADKLFQIEGGALVFDTPDPTDPRLDVRASWRAPDDQTLYMYVTGTLSNPKVLFDRPQQDALSLLGGSTAGTTGLGLSVIDTLLAGTPLARVQLRGTDSEDDTKGATYTAAYRASDRVIVEGNYQAASSANPEEATMVGAAVDYRMTKTVSVRAQLGTIGTGVDLLYQYRY